MKAENHPKTEAADPSDAVLTAQQAIQVAMDRRDNGGASAERDR